MVGLVTIGQSPRPDVLPDMAAVIGPGVEIREAGALDGLSRAEIDALAPRDAMAGLTGAPVLLANLLVARVVAELGGV